MSDSTDLQAGRQQAAAAARRIAAAAVTEAARAAGRLANPADAAALIDLGSIRIDDTGQADTRQVAEAVRQVHQRFGQLRWAAASQQTLDRHRATVRANRAPADIPDLQAEQMLRRHGARMATPITGDDAA